ncbi:MAG: phosphatase PAP2 family protein [Micrococcaceae bacterium]
MEAIQNVDSGFTVFITKDRNPFLNGFAEVLQFVGMKGMFIAFAFLIGYFLYRSCFRVATFAILAVLFVTAISEGIKHMVRRPRPDQALQVIHETGYSFPSGHSAVTTCFVTVCILIFRQKWVKIVGVIFTLLMLWSRTYLGVHYLSDVIVGALVGFVSAVLAWWLVRNYYDVVYDKLFAKTIVR